MHIKEKETSPPFISKINWNCEKQIILLIIPNKEKEGWHYLVVKKLFTLLRAITSNNLFKRMRKNIIDFEKRKMLPLTKEVKITSRCKNMLYLWKKNLKNAL